MMVDSKKVKKIGIESSSSNLFADLGVENAEKHLAKVELARQINRIINKRSLKQIEAANILQIDQPKVSALSCGRLDSFSIERLITFLNRLSCDVEIVVKTKRRSNHLGSLKVASI